MSGSFFEDFVGPRRPRTGGPLRRELGAAEGRVIAHERVASLVAPARAAAVTYSVARSSPARREWLVLLADGTTVFSGASGERHPLAAPPALPLQLVAMSQTTYVLAADKQDLCVAARTF